MAKSDEITKPDAARPEALKKAPTRKLTLAEEDAAWAASTDPKKSDKPPSEQPVRVRFLKAGGLNGKMFKPGKVGEITRGSLSYYLSIGAVELL